MNDQSQQSPTNQQPDSKPTTQPYSLQPEERAQPQQDGRPAAVTARQTTSTSTTGPPMVRTPLAKAMAIDGGDRLDFGVLRTRAMRTERNGPYERIEPQAEEEEPPVAHFNFPEPTEANLALAKEFVCFTAKRKNKSDSHEINYGRASDEMKRKLNESRAKEWSKYKAIRFPTQAEIESLLLAGESVIPMRWVDIDKNEKLRAPGDTTIPEKLKSRLVIRGDLEDGNFRTDCPTASSTAVHILLSYASCKKLKLKSGDISAAFLQGAPIQRVLLLSAPRDGIPVEGGHWISPEEYMIALMSVYGSKDAPRGFWLELCQTIIDNGVVEIEPAFLRPDS